MQTIHMSKKHGYQLIEALRIEADEIATEERAELVREAAAEIEKLILENRELSARVAEMLDAAKEVDEWHDLIRQNYPEMIRPFARLRAAINQAEGK